MNRHPRWEVVRTAPARYHSRFVSSNGNVIVTSESYQRRREALRAIEVVCGELIEYKTFSFPLAVYSDGHGAYVEVRMVAA